MKKKHEKHLLKTKTKKVYEYWTVALGENHPSCDARSYLISELREFTFSAPRRFISKKRPLTNLLSHSEIIHHLSQKQGSRSRPFTEAAQGPMVLYKPMDIITKNTVLFEGCDYQHWLIVMEFEKKEIRENMITTYESVCMFALGISLEAAKQKIYAFSTTSYHGFHVTMSEEESRKFEVIGPMIFILPDVYTANNMYGSGSEK